VIGAVYLDGGFEEARKFIRRHILNDMDRKQLFFDSKTILQELIQENTQSGIEYVLEKEEGPDHDKLFTFSVMVNGEVLGTGTGHTKKAAEQSAAYMAIQKIRQA
jgi:ribonuclease-3